MIAEIFSSITRAWPIYVGLLFTPAIVGLIYGSSQWMYREHSLKMAIEAAGEDKCIALTNSMTKQHWMGPVYTVGGFALGVWLVAKTIVDIPF
jgi:hypothetical protein